MTTCRLVGGALGSTHMALTLVSLEDGYVSTHLHSFETSFYVLEGEPVLYLDGRGVTLMPGACGCIPVGMPHAFRADARGLWLEMASPRPRIPRTRSSAKAIFSSPGSVLPGGARLLPARAVALGESTTRSVSSGVCKLPLPARIVCGGIL